MITKNVDRAIELLLDEDVVAIPTETVYGLAGNALSEKALKKIFSLKNRPLFNPLIVHIGGFNQLQKIARDIPEKAIQLALHFWPGPLTLVLKKQTHIPDLVTSGKDTVAIRMPNHPLTLELLNQIDFPLAAPSANPFGKISPTSAAHVYDYFGENVTAILDGGDCERGVESTIIGFENEVPVLYRVGSISVEEIESVVGEVISPQNNSEIKSPGMLQSHYAPRTDTILNDNPQKLLGSLEGKKIGLLLFKDELGHKNVSAIEVLSKKGDLKEAAKNLYAAMHRLDNLDLDLIIAERLPDYGLGRTINDRLTRASSKYTL